MFPAMTVSQRALSTVSKLLLSLALATAAWPAHAQDQVSTERVTATLLAERTSIAPGETIWVGLKLEMAEGWHTYWRNPGDSGLATTIDWQLPQGIEAGPIQWPMPERQPYGPLMNFGYSDEVTLLARLSVAADAPTGRAVIAARSTWLVCADICVPEDGAFSLPLDIDTAAPRASTLAGAHLSAVAGALPDPVPGMVSATLTDEALIVDAEWPNAPAGDIVFFPYPTYLMDNVASQTVTRSDNGFRIEVATVPDPEYGETIGGLFKVIGPSETTAVAFENAPLTVGSAPSFGSDNVASPDMSLIVALAFAFLGGLILNLMPCVLPVLSIKALAVVKHGSGEATRRDATAYTAGVMASFAALVGVLLALKAGGESLGWGFQLQSPGFVTLLAYLMLAVGLSLSGVFNIGSGLMGAGSRWTHGDGPLGSFLTGVLAAVVATPCTAPFMAPAIGFALTQPPMTVFLIFESLALGLAAPFLLIGFVPALARALPKPGAWMETFKQILAFPMYGAAAWLVWVVAQQVGPMGLAATLAGMICVAFAAWLYGRSNMAGNRAQVVFASLAAISVAGGIFLASVPQPLAGSPSNSAPSESARWEPYSPDRLSTLRANGEPVFVNFTAAWCITCLMNERAVISTEDVQQAISDNGVVYLKADWTNRDPAITAALDSFGRSGVPLYVLYDRSGQPQVQPQILTRGSFVEALNAL